MESIFDPPAGTCTFTAADWLAVIDVLVDGAPQTDTSAEALVEAPATAAPALRRRALRNWHKFVLCSPLILVGGALLVYGEADGINDDTRLFLAGVTLAVGLIIVLLMLVIAWRYDRL
jgi:hypothetical protein